MKRATWILSLAALMMVAGCGMPGAGTTAKETLTNLAAALELGDGAAVANCFKASDAGKKLLAQIGESTSVMKSYAAKMTAVYGDKVVLERDQFLSMIENVSKATFTPIGDTKATAIVSGWPGVIALEKNPTTLLWEIDDPYFKTMTEEQFAAKSKPAAAHLAAVQATMPDIGKEGVEYDTILQTIAARTKENLTAPAPPAAPHPAEPDHRTEVDHPAAPSHPVGLPDLPKPPADLPDLPKPPARSTVKLPPMPPEPLDPAGHGRLPSVPRPTFVDTSTPKATIQSLATAIEQGDGPALVRLYKTNEQGRKALLGMASGVKAMIDFSVAMKSAYGTQGGNVFGTDGPFALVANVDQVTITDNGTTATAMIPGDRTPTVLVKENNQWLVVDQGLDKTSAAELTKLLSNFKLLQTAITKVTPEIGAPGSTIASIMTKLQQELRGGN
ncbi:MAG: hypothetical protein HN909_06030 [Phycisphaerales bacterium]|jgi:hypothetical protein|nr:hypothetical protein [Phycisphaerales bacterium]MBT7171311.1 hypothetical protein [Phycisphaerales bacterium]